MHARLSFVKRLVSTFDSDWENNVILECWIRRTYLQITWWWRRDDAYCSRVEAFLETLDDAVIRGTVKSGREQVCERKRIGCAVQKLSRKLVHILSGLVFMLFWPLFRWGSRGRGRNKQVNQFWNPPGCLYFLMNALLWMCSHTIKTNKTTVTSRGYKAQGFKATEVFQVVQNRFDVSDDSPKYTDFQCWDSACIHSPLSELGYWGLQVTPFTPFPWLSLVQIVQYLCKRVIRCRCVDMQVMSMCTSRTSTQRHILQTSCRCERWWESRSLNET